MTTAAQRIVLIGVLLLLALALTAPGFAAPEPFASPLPTCQQPVFYRVASVYGRDYDPDLGKYVTWQLYLESLLDGRYYSVMTWWPNYAPGDLIRLCAGELYPYGEWQRTYLPLLRK